MRFYEKRHVSYAKDFETLGFVNSIISTHLSISYINSMLWDDDIAPLIDAAIVV